MNNKIFISYKRQKRALITKFAEGLARKGFAVFWDAQLRASNRYIQKINRELLESDAVIVCWCSQSVTSPWVISEATKAFHRRTLLPIKLETLDDLEIPVPFNIVQAHDMSAWDGSEDHRDWIDLLRDIKELCESSDHSDVILDEEADSIAITEEIYSSVSTPKSEIQNTHSPAEKIQDVKEYVLEIIRKSKVPITQALLAQKIQQRWPDTAQQFNWFGFRRFSQLVVALDLTPDELSMIGSSALVTEDFRSKILKRIEAPKISPEKFRAIIKATAGAINAGHTTLSDISAATRDALAGTEHQVGRAACGYVAKGALIEGLDTSKTPISPGKVAFYYARAINSLSAASGHRLDPEEQEKVLEIIGFSDLSGLLGDFAP